MLRALRKTGRGSLSPVNLHRAESAEQVMPNVERGIDYCVIEGFECSVTFEAFHEAAIMNSLKRALGSDSTGNGGIENEIYR